MNFKNKHINTQPLFKCIYLPDRLLVFIRHCVFTVCIWALHFLSTSEEVQDRLHKEFEEVLGSGPVSLEKIPQLR